jgi:hypothetical protein
MPLALRRRLSQGVLQRFFQFHKAIPHRWRILPGFKSGYQPVAKFRQLCMALLVIHNCENKDPYSRFQTKRPSRPAANSRRRSVCFAT